MPVSDAAGKQMLAEGALSLRPSTVNPPQAVQPGNISGATTQNLEANPQPREM